MSKTTVDTWTCDRCNGTRTMERESVGDPYGWIVLRSHQLVPYAKHLGGAFELHFCEACVPHVTVAIRALCSGGGK